MTNNRNVRKSQRFSQLMLRFAAILAIVLMATPMVPAQILAGHELEKDIFGSNVDVKTTSCTGQETIPDELISRAAAYPSLINTSMTDTATANNFQRKVVRGNNGTIHEVHDSSGVIWYAQSWDDGQTWTNLTNISNNNRVNTVPAIATNGTAIYIVYRDQKDLRFRRSLDGGITWNPALNQDGYEVYDGSPGWAQTAPPASVAANGTWVYVAMERNDGGWPWDSEIYVWRNNNNGATANWAGPVKANVNNNDDDLEPSMVALGNTVHISYTSELGGDREIYYVRSNDNAQTFPTTVQLSTNTAVDQSSSIVAFATNVSIGWESDVTGDWEIFLRNSTNSGTNWDAAVNVSANASESRYPSLARSFNITYILWQDMRDHNTGDIFYAKYDKQVLSTPIDLTNSDETNIRPSAIMFTSNSRVYYSWEMNSPDPNKVMFSYYYVLPNKAPTLSYTGEQNYITDGLDPEGNSTGYTYTYRVDYTDADDDAPMDGYPEVWIDFNRDGDYNDANEQKSMSETNNQDQTYSDGKRYTYSATFSAIGTYSYTFRATDNKGARATGAPLAVHVGPKIDRLNLPPVLMWTEDLGYLDDGVEPEKGMVGDTFTYKVRYVDVYNEPPLTGYPKLRVDMDQDGIFTGPADKEYSMLEVNSLDKTYTAPGKIYYYNLTFDAPETYGYMFYAINNVNLPNQTANRTGPVVEIKTNKPTLTFTGETGFETDGVNPNQGSKYTDFEFRILYSDLDNETPQTNVTVGIDINLNGVFDTAEWHVMTAVNVSDTNYVDGKIYSYHTTFVQGIYNYTFRAKDSAGAPAIGDGTLIKKVYVNIVNEPPVLRWTLEDNYTSGGLWPTEGTTNLTVFTYRVKYEDADNNPPALDYPMVGIDLDLSGTFDTSEYFTMTEVSSSDTQYSDGKLYSHSRTFSKLGQYKFTFVGKDDRGDLASGAPTAIFNGPSLTSEHIVTYPPTLSWVGSVGYEDGGVQPLTGTTTTNFVFRIAYTDVDNDKPASGSPKVWIDVDGDGVFNGSADKSVILTEEDASETSVVHGKVYNGTTTMASKGVYNYTFEAASTRAGEAAVALGLFKGTFTVARGNLAPTLAWVGTGGHTNDGVDPNEGAPGITVFKYQVKYTDTDGDAPAAGYPKAYIDLNGDGLYNELTEVFTMTKVGTGVADYTKGVIFEKVAVTFTTEATFKYKFTAQDSLGTDAAELAAVGPTVAKPIINAMPQLLFPGDANFKYDGLDPVKGTKKTKFVFRVIYMDPEADAPQAGYPQLYLDLTNDGDYLDSNEKQAMQPESSADFTTGRVYKLEMQLTPGNVYKYAFYANNTKNQTAYLGEFEGPIVEKEVKKTPTGMGDNFWLIILIVAVIVALIIGLLIGRSKVKKAEAAMAESEPEQREARDIEPDDDGGGQEPQDDDGGGQEPQDDQPNEEVDK